MKASLIIIAAALLSACGGDSGSDKEKKEPQVVIAEAKDSDELIEASENTGGGGVTIEIVTTVPDIGSITGAETSANIPLPETIPEELDPSNSSVFSRITLDKAEVHYLAYQISDNDWIEVTEAVEIEVIDEQTLTLASICTNEDSESYNSQAVVHNIESLTGNNITTYNPRCGFFSGSSVEGSNVTITSQQEEISIGAVSTPNILNVQSLEQDFRLTVSSEGPLDIAVVGFSQEKEFYIHKSLNNTIKDIDNIIIDFYSEDSVKVIEFHELPLNNWDYIDLLYTVDNLLIPLFNHWKNDSESSTYNQFISIPEKLKNESGRYLNFSYKVTEINDYILEAWISSVSYPIIETLPEDLSSLNNINIDYSEDNERYTLSINSDIRSIIPLPLNNFSIERSSSQGYHPFNPAPPYWDKKQITTSYIVTKNQSISLTPIEFHLLPNSPIGALSSDEITSISSHIDFLNRQVNSENLDYYKLSRNLNEFIAN